MALALTLPGAYPSEPLDRGNCLVIETPQGRIRIWVSVRKKGRKVTLLTDAPAPHRIRRGEHVGPDADFARAGGKDGGQ
jgi:hypothetical protein